MRNPHVNQDQPKGLQKYCILDRISNFSGAKPTGMNFESVELKESEQTRTLLWNLMQTMERGFETNCPKNRMYGLLTVPPHPKNKGPSWIKGPKYTITHYFAISGSKQEEYEKLLKHVLSLFKCTNVELIENNQNNITYTYFFSTSSNTEPSTRIVVCTSSEFYGIRGNKIDVPDWSCAAGKLLTAAFSDFGEIFKTNNTYKITEAFNWLNSWEMSEISYLKKNSKYPLYEQANSCDTCKVNLPGFFS